MTVKSICGWYFSESRNVLALMMSVYISMVYCIIPARLDSTRLPRKLLLNKTGKSLLQHTWEAARSSPKIDHIIIATDSAEIAATAAGFQARVVLTAQHTCGTNRVAEVAKRLCAADDIIINLQGDEPEILPENLERLIDALGTRDMATLVTPIEESLAADPSNVKCVCSADGSALYFSRLPIPRRGPWLLHIGVYAFKNSVLSKFAGLPTTILEDSEQLEQLRALESGFTIMTQQIDTTATGIDTLDDYNRFVSRYSSSH